MTKDGRRWEMSFISAIIPSEIWILMSFSFKGAFILVPRNRIPRRWKPWKIYRKTLRLLDSPWQSTRFVRFTLPSPSTFNNIKTSRIIRVAWTSASGSSKNGKREKLGDNRSGKKFMIIRFRMYCKESLPSFLPFCPDTRYPDQFLNHRLRQRSGVFQGVKGGKKTKNVKVL